MTNKQAINYKLTNDPDFIKAVRKAKTKRKRIAKTAKTLQDKIERLRTFDNELFFY